MRGEERSRLLYCNSSFYLISRFLNISSFYEHINYCQTVLIFFIFLFISLLFNRNVYGIRLSSFSINFFPHFIVRVFHNVVFLLEYLYSLCDYIVIGFFIVFLYLESLSWGGYNSMQNGDSNFRTMCSHVSHQNKLTFLNYISIIFLTY